MSLFFVCLLLTLFSTNVAAQALPETSSGIFSVPGRFLAKLESKASGLQSKVITETEKSLNRLKKQERKLKKRLMKKDSVAAKELFANSEQQYDEMISKMRDGNFSAIEGKKYDAHFDTLVTSLKFLDNNVQGVANSKSQLLSSAQGNLKGLDNKLDYTQNVKSFLKQRQALLKEQCQKFGFGKSLLKYNKQAYYYSQQISEYKAIFKQPDQLERKVIGALQKLPVFQNFMQKNSQFAALFPLPAGNAAGLPGGSKSTPALDQLSTVRRTRGPYDDVGLRFRHGLCRLRPAGPAHRHR